MPNMHDSLRSTPYVQGSRDNGREHHEDEQQVGNILKRCQSGASVQPQNRVKDRAGLMNRKHALNKQTVHQVVGGSDSVEQEYSAEPFRLFVQ
ncbi:hypothetical protein PAV_3c00850 [Paenibacillus alvei DSM 29]|nr:hypothetical protein PAV_3c00850 [Paenibacillus alvei DSM 29]